MNKKVSIITVVLNEGDYFKWTLESIRDQKYDNIEYIVVDGGSEDNTLNLIETYKDVISRWITEPDEGLYYAMNKGLSMASGEYVMFLNAGDMFFNDDVLHHIFSCCTQDADVYYGKTMIIDRQGRELGMRRLQAPKQLTWRSLKNGMIVCHQSFIAKRSIVPFYNTRFRIASDYLWVLQTLQQAKKIINTEIIISRFLEGGINKYNIVRANWERFIIMTGKFGFFPAMFRHFIIIPRFIYYFIKHKRF